MGLFTRFKTKREQATLAPDSAPVSARDAQPASPDKPGRPKDGAPAATAESAERRPIAKPAVAKPAERRPAAKPAKPTPQPQAARDVDLDAARAIVIALSHAPGVDAKVRAAIARLQSASGGSSDFMEISLAYANGDAGLIHRPWVWLAAITERANAEGQHDIAAMAYMFVWWWTKTMEPNLSGADRVNLCLDPVPADARATIFREGRAAANALPTDHVVATSSDGRATTAQTLRSLP